MADMTLERFAYSPMGAFGTLSFKTARFFTVERPWLNNDRGKSCIPEGRYVIRMSRFHKGGYDAYEITGVPGRSRILIHVANTMDDIEGCVGLGSALGYVNGKWGVLGSKDAFKRFMDMAMGKEYTMEIRQYKPEPAEKVT